MQAGLPDRRRHSHHADRRSPSAMSPSLAVERVIGAARQTAAQYNHAFVGTEHLLAALLDEPDSLTATLVTRTGLQPADVRRGLLEGLRQAQASEPRAPDDVPLSSFAQRAIEGVADEAELLRRLIANPKGRIAQVLRADPKALTALKAAVEPDKGSTPVERPKEPKVAEKKAPPQQRPARNQRPRGGDTRPEAPEPRVAPPE